MVNLCERKEEAYLVNEMVVKGTIFDNLKFLGEGISGKVYELGDTAVKVFKEGGKEKNDFFMLAHLENSNFFPNLIYYNEGSYMMSEKINGVTLSTYLKDGGKFTERHISQLESLFESMYHNKVLPRDLHLNNIMIDENNQLKVVDVGRFHLIDNQSLNYQVEMLSRLNKLKNQIRVQSSASSPFIDISISIGDVNISISLPSW